jgi:hypothetical protein
MANPSENLIVWLKDPPAEFKEFMARIIEHLELAKGSAMAKGDTEYEKGQVVGLQRVIALPKTLIESFDKTEGTDSDT